jgi:hypothetical protein
MRQRVAVRLLLMSAAFSLVIALPGPGAQALVNRFTVKDNSPKPAECAGTNEGTIRPGTWLTNKQCGYYVGRAMPGSSFDSHHTDSRWRRFGRSWGNNNFCAWIHRGALHEPPVGQAPESCSDATRERISHRLSFGRDFNAPPHQATGGSSVSVDPSCGFYLNYFTSSSFDSGSLRDLVGAGGLTSVSYRFSSKDGAVIVAHSSALDQWGFMSRSCVTGWRGVEFNNEDD